MNLSGHIPLKEIYEEDELPIAGRGDGPITRCQAGSDGECFHGQCPQIRDSEPVRSGRHCPLDTWCDDD